MKKYLTIFLFSVLYAVGVSCFLDPNGLVPGGVTGISILLSTLTKIETGTWVFILNIPIMLLGWWKFGAKFMISTIFSTGVISAATNLLAPIGALSRDQLSASLAGAFLTAVSVAMIMKCQATTGGLDIIVKLLRLKHPHLKTGRLFLMIDSFIVLAAILVYGNVESGIYAGITVLVASYLMDLVLYGTDEAKFYFIITEKTDLTVKRLMSELEVGVTKVEAVGTYYNKKKSLLLCVTKKNQGPKLEKIVCEVDQHAFLIVTSANEIYGEGYKSYLEQV